MNKTQRENITQNNEAPNNTKPSWFEVGGDLDDFIFYNENTQPCSQR